MAALTPLRVQKAVTIVGACIEAQIANHTDQATELRSVLYVLSRVQPPDRMTPALTSAVVSPAKGKRPQAGSLPARILDILGELDQDSVTIKQVMAAKPGANEAAVRYQLQKLVKAGWAVAVGETSQRRYGLPAKKGR
jgi:hypothetical protein